MATESGFSRGWKQFVDHKWIKKLTSYHPTARLDSAAGACKLPRLSVCSGWVLPKLVGYWHCGRNSPLPKRICESLFGLRLCWVRGSEEWVARLGGRTYAPTNQERV